MDCTTQALAAGPRAVGTPLGAKILKRLYTTNPFYVISADLVFVGLRLSFDTNGKTFGTGALMASLLGYTLLLAATAWALIRWGNVWDDARTILLLVVAMFLAVSVTFDATLTARPELGKALYVLGLLFAVVVSEGLLWGIRLRLPTLWRGPYYLLLGLFFLYPVGLAPLSDDPDGDAIRWALHGFPALGGLAFLTLIPAARRGAALLEKNGSPWRYPLYPWVLFGLLGMAVCGRSYSLCISFHFVGKSYTVFGPYFLVPFLFAVDLVILEAGLASKGKGGVKFAILALPAIVALAGVGHRPDVVYRGFLGLYAEVLGGSPLFLGVLAASAFSAYAAARGAGVGISGLAASLLTLAVVGPGTFDWQGLVAPRTLPMLAAGLVLASRGGSWGWLAGSLCVIVGVDAWLGTGAWRVDYVLGLLVALGMGLVFEDDLGTFLRGLGAWMLVLPCLAILSRADGGVEEGVWEIVVPAGLVVAMAYGVLTGSRPYYAVAAVIAAGWTARMGWRVYGGVRRALPGADWVVLGLVFFGLGAGISLGKAGECGAGGRGLDRRGGRSGLGGALAAFPDDARAAGAGGGVEGGRARFVGVEGAADGEDVRVEGVDPPEGLPALGSVGGGDVDGPGVPGGLEVERVFHAQLARAGVVLIAFDDEDPGADLAFVGLEAVDDVFGHDPDALEAGLVVEVFFGLVAGEGGGVDEQAEGCDQGREGSGGHRRNPPRARGALAVREGSRQGEHNGETG